MAGWQHSGSGKGSSQKTASERSWAAPKHQQHRQQQEAVLDETAAQATAEGTIRRDASTPKGSSKRHQQKASAKRQQQKALAKRQHQKAAAKGNIKRQVSSITRQQQRAVSDNQVTANIRKGVASCFLAVPWTFALSQPSPHASPLLRSCPAGVSGAGPHRSVGQPRQRRCR